MPESVVVTTREASGAGGWPARTYHRPIPTGRSKSWAKGQAAVRQRSERALVAGLGRVTGRKPVTPEYPLHPRPRWGWTGPAPAALIRLLDEREPESEATVQRALALETWRATVTFDPDPSDPAAPCWDNEFWGGLDALVQVGELKHRNPARYLEVGSGWSTRFARRAVRDFDLQTEITSIDPFPRADVDTICDRVVRQPLEDIDLGLFGELAAGDILLIDGSHTAFMNSDATILFGEVLPQLPAGVLVGIDDIFLPWDYPPTWEDRLYGEQYLLATMLLGGAVGWAIRFAGFHLTRVSAGAPRFDPLWPGIETRHGRLATSFWLERT